MRAYIRLYVYEYIYFYARAIIGDDNGREVLQYLPM